ncbi:AAA family ATPase [Rhodococcus sp. USK10]|nr:AAA family ATPase [Rhodococcus sp. USK10]
MEYVRRRWQHREVVEKARKVVGNLPMELTSFVGRRREQSEVKRLLSVTRLVTLTGIGGVGKTRLALRAAAAAQRAFSDAVWLVELGEVRDASLLAETIAVALRVRNHTNRPIYEVLAEHLTSRQLLLVLDNCEHILSAVAELSEALLRTCPELRILTTSREPLNIGGESIMRVPPLETPDLARPQATQGQHGYDAVTLFAERARSNLPEFELTDENRMTVAQICHRLDGLPLPIELAAARLRAMSTSQILDHLTDRYELLTSGHRGAPSRQQTLRLSVDWSYDLCTPQEQSLWARLSVFAGGVEFDAIAGVCVDEWTDQKLLDVVGSLVDKSILIREEPGPVVRYRLLETLREYGLEKLGSSGDYPTLRRRHKDWFGRLAALGAEGWVTSQHGEWMSRLDREQPNLRDAMEFCLTEPGEGRAGLLIATTLYPFWLTRGLFGEGRRWLDRALQVQNESTGDRAQALFIDSVLAGLQGDTLSATALIDEAVAIGDRSTDGAVQPFAEYAIGFHMLYQGEPSRAVTHLGNALALFRDQGNTFMQLGSVQGLGLANMILSDMEQAVSRFYQALELSKPCGPSVLQSYPLWALGISLWRQGDPGEAVRSLERGLRLTRQVDDPLATAWCLQVLAWIAADQHHEKRAATLLGAADALWQQMGGENVTFSDMQVFQDVCERQARSALGTKGFEAASVRGKEMDRDAAVAFALDELPTSKRTHGGELTELTKREKEVATLVSQGLTNKVIAERLVISQRTAQGHVENILMKLGFTSRTQIATWFVEQR